jgi:hypothetical protein
MISIVSDAVELVSDCADYRSVSGWDAVVWCVVRVPPPSPILLRKIFKTWDIGPDLGARMG